MTVCANAQRKDEEGNPLPALPRRSEKRTFLRLDGILSCLFPQPVPVCIITAQGNGIYLNADNGELLPEPRINLHYS